MMTENHGFVSERETCATSEGSSATLWIDGLHWANYGNDTIGTETNTTGVSNWQGSDHSSSILPNSSVAFMEIGSRLVYFLGSSIDFMETHSITLFYLALLCLKCP
jgi:hypothetical protein